MALAPGNWASQQLVEFLDAVISFDDEPSALRGALDRVVEAFDAAAGAVLAGDEVVAAVGYPRGAYPRAELVDAAAGRSATVEVPGAGTCHVAAARFDGPADRALIVARPGGGTFDADELHLLRGMARVLRLALGSLRSLAHERERRSFLEQLSRIQRSISHGEDQEAVLRSIVEGAHELLRGDVIGLRRLDGEGRLELVASIGIDEELADTVRSRPLDHGLSGQAVREGRLVVTDDYATSPVSQPELAGRGLRAVMAAPVRSQGEIVGSLVVSTRDPERRYGTTEQEMLVALADHAGIALGDIAAREARDRAEHQQREVEARLAQSERLESVGRLAGGIAHDFNNLLAVIINYAALVSSDLPDDSPMREDVDEIRRTADRAAALTRRLLIFSRQDPMHELVQLNDVVEDVEELLRRTLGARVELVSSLASGLPQIEADVGQLEQIVVNLAVNARDAMPGGGTLTVTTESCKVDAEYASARPGLEPGDYVELGVGDTGTGMAPEVAARAFDPFFTTKPPGQGTGLGLATVYGIVKQADGYVELDTRPGEGTRFRMLFPVAASSGQRPLDSAGPPTAPEEAGEGERVLLAEDDESVRTLIERVLRRGGYRAEVCRNGAEAAARFDEEPDGFDLLVTDVVMPGLTGPELAQRVHRRRPELPVIYISGYTGDYIARHGGLESGARLVQKPFGPDVLLRAVREALAEDPSVAQA